MLADDELLVGSDLHKALRSDGVEATSAGISIVNGNDCKVVVDAGADALIGAHCPGIDLGSALLPHCHEPLLILGCGLDDVCELFLLGLEVLVPYGDVILQALYILLLLSDSSLGIVDGLHRDLAQKSLVLYLLVDGVELTAVGNLFQLLLVLLYLKVTVYDATSGLFFWTAS